MRIVAAGDAALTLELDERIDAAVNAQAVTAARAVRNAALDGVRDVVSAYRTVTVYFDPLRADPPAIGLALAEAASAGSDAVAEGRRIRVPVCYGGEFGPDIGEVAAFGGLSEADVVERHTAHAYRVFMLGFVPGFAYLGVVDDRIAVPRRATPRTHVVEGSVAIAGRQTGIYPQDTPGGWQVIGRTPLKLFDPANADPNLLAAGDEVRFEAIDRAAFDRLREAR